MDPDPPRLVNSKMGAVRLALPVVPNAVVWAWAKGSIYQCAVSGGAGR